MRERLDSHKLIEEFMVLANVAAAQALEQRHSACLYRVHDQPDAAKIEGLREFLVDIPAQLAPFHLVLSLSTHKDKARDCRCCCACRGSFVVDVVSATRAPLLLLELSCAGDEEN